MADDIEMIMQAIKELSGGMKSMHNELTGEINGIRTELKDEINGLRTELKDEMNTLRTELTDEMNTLRTELTDEMNTLRTELSARMDKLDVQMEMLKEDNWKTRFEVEKHKKENRLEIEQTGIKTRKTANKMALTSCRPNDTFFFTRILQSHPAKNTIKMTLNSKFLFLSVCCVNQYYRIPLR
ncbi:hypothetical protein QS257_11265 [Terrilactibacillus sp. S3-3]|nr:hypothetical protein QS257_11265 [Terrilactibacillus sp. S3-3]